MLGSVDISFLTMQVVVELEILCVLNVEVVVTLE